MRILIYMLRKGYLIFLNMIIQNKSNWEPKSNIQSKLSNVFSDYSNLENVQNKWPHTKDSVRVRGHMSWYASKTSYLYFFINKQNVRTIFIWLWIFTYFIYTRFCYTCDFLVLSKYVCSYPLFLFFILFLISILFSIIRFPFDNTFCLLLIFLSMTHSLLFLSIYLQSYIILNVFVNVVSSSIVL